MILIALLGLGTAALVHDAAAAAGAVLGLLNVFPVLLRMSGDQDWQRLLYRIGSAPAGLTGQTTLDTGSLPICPWAGLAVTAGWAAAALSLGAVSLCRRDAG